MTVRSLGVCLFLAMAPIASYSHGQPVQTVVQPAAGQQKLPTATELFDRHIEAVGGIDAIRKHTSLKFTGTIKIPSIKYTAFTTIWQVAPNSFVMHTEPPGGARGEIYCDGVHAWERMPAPDGSSLLVLYTDSRWTDAMFSADFYADADYTNRYAAVKTIELTDFNGKPAYKVFAQAKLGKQLFIFFDQVSGLIVGYHSVQSEGGQTIPLIMIYDEYKEVDGVKYISGVTQRTPSADVVLTYRVIEPSPSDIPKIEIPEELRAQVAELGAAAPPSDKAELPPTSPPVEEPK